MNLKKILIFLCAILTASTAAAQQLSGGEILERVESLLWGRTLQGDFSMTIQTPRWQRSLELRVWMERPGRSFVRILAPAKEAGIGSLRIGNEMWNYLPAVERTIKIPPSMMLQAWMGSDFTNDDLVKQSSIVRDYTHQWQEIIQEGGTLYRIEARPKPEAAVVWGKIIYLVRKTDFVPLRQEFYSESGELLRVLTFSELRVVDGRLLPTRWEMRPLAKPGNLTTVRLKDALFERAIAADIFTQRHLQKP